MRLVPLRQGPRAQTVCSGGCSLAALNVPVDQVRVMFQTVPPARAPARWELGTV